MLYWVKTIEPCSLHIVVSIFIGNYINALLVKGSNHRALNILFQYSGIVNPFDTVPDL